MTWACAVQIHIVQRSAVLKILVNQKKRLYVCNNASRSHGVPYVLYVPVYCPASLTPFFIPFFPSSSFHFFPVILAYKLGNGCWNYSNNSPNTAH